MSRQELGLSREERLEQLSTVYEIGLDCHVKKTIDVQDAINGLIPQRNKKGEMKAKYSPFKWHPTKMIRSAGNHKGERVEMAWPIIVQLTHWVDIPFHPPADWSDRAPRIGILRRDGWMCGYRADNGLPCPNPADTVDHVTPESRGGGWTWGNLISACEACNQKKADREPGEAGMKMLWDTYVGAEFAGVQAEVWRILQES